MTNSQRGIKQHCYQKTWNPKLCISCSLCWHEICFCHTDHPSLLLPENCPAGFTCWSHLDKAPLAVSEQASGWPKCELKPEETVAFVGWQFFLIKPAWHFINATEASVPLQILRMMDNHFCSLTHTRDIPPCQLNIPTQASLKDCLLYEETAWKRNSSICAKTESILKSSRQKLEEAEHTRNE